MSLSNPSTFKERNPLFQQDLFECILDCLVEGNTQSEGGDQRAVLCSLAQTCRAFSGPSLDRLWKKLDSLEPLIRCYATALNEETANTPPSLTEWAIIHRYSYRIQELQIRIRSRFSMSFLRATSLFPSLLVPNLRVLGWHPCHPMNQAPTLLPIVFIRQLLSPSLISLGITLNDSEDGTLRSFLASLPFHCSNLQSVAINIPYGVSHTTVRSLSEAITHHVHLECLHLSTPVDDVALAHIAMSPSLKTLSLVLCPDTLDLRRICIPSDVTPFCNVEDLCLEVWDLDVITTLLRPQHQMFSSFVVSRATRPTTNTVLAFLTALASCSRARSLQMIGIMLDVHRQRFAFAEPTIHHHVFYNTLQPLTSLCRLHTLEVDLGLWISIDDDELISLVRNWPLLQTLDLQCTERVHDRPWQWAKYVTFKGLLSLLQCCPDLHNLSLSLDARQIPTDMGDIVCNPNLTQLRFSESPISDPHSVEDVLRRHFPSVEVVWIQFSMVEDQEEAKLYVESWNEVNKYLHNIHLPG